MVRDSRIITDYSLSMGRSNDVFRDTAESRGRRPPLNVCLMVFTKFILRLSCRIGTVLSQHSGRTNQNCIIDSWPLIGP